MAPEDIPPAGLEDALRGMERASAELAAKAVVRMRAALPWIDQMPARHQASLGLVVQAGFALFVQWCRRPADSRELSTGVFRVAPRELVRAVTLQQLVELVRVAVEVIEAEVPTFAADREQEERLRADVLRYSRDIAFAGALVYARAAEERGAWDARLEALVVDHVIRGEVDHGLASRAAALGWRTPSAITVVVGVPPAAEPEAVVDDMHRLARASHLDVLTGVHGDRLVAMVSTPVGGEPGTVATELLPAYGEGPVVYGPVARDLAEAATAASVALAGAAAVAGWPGAPRPVGADDLLAERALAGDERARRTLVENVYIPLRAAGPALADTAGAYFECGGSLEGTARAMFLHPNTVRYRLRKVADACGLQPTRPREGFTLRVALIVGRLTVPQESDVP